MKVRYKLSMTFLIFLSSALYAQEAKAPKPKLTDSVALDLRTLREQIANSNVQLLMLEKQYKAIQEQQTQLNGTYAERLKSALKRSDLDETKYELDLNTLDIKEKPSAKSQDKK